MDIVVAITLFVLALLIGVEVIGKVPATLHTPEDFDFAHPVHATQWFLNTRNKIVTELCRRNRTVRRGQTDHLQEACGRFNNRHA